MKTFKFNCLLKMVLSALVCALNAVPLKGQTNKVYGRVIDAKDNAVLEGVAVYWVDIDGNRLKEVATNQQGIYTIEKYDLAVSIVFEFDGKETQIWPVSKIKHGELDILLNDRAPFSVTGSRWEQSVYETPASVVIIDRKKIAQSGFLTLQEILESIPGMYTIDHRTESDVTIGIRGFWSPYNRNVMIQLNGVNMLSERHFDFPLHKINVPVEAIDRVEVIRGPMSVIYGSGAFFGVINIITNQAGKAQNGFATRSIGSQNSDKLFIRYALSKDNWKLALNAYRYRREGFAEEWEDLAKEDVFNVFEDSARKIRPEVPADSITQLYLGQTIDPGRFGREHTAFNLSAHQGNFSAELNYASSEFGIIYTVPGIPTRNEYRSSTFNAEIGYRGTFKKYKLDYEVKLAYMTSSAQADYNYYFEDAYSTGLDRLSSTRAEINARKVLINNGNSRQMDIIGGVFYYINPVNHSIYDIPEFKMRNWYLGLSEGGTIDTKAAYLQLNSKWHDFQLVVGGRLEDISDYPLEYRFNEDVPDTVPVLLKDKMTANEPHFTTRLALIYSLKEEKGNHQYLKAIYGRAKKQPSLIDNPTEVMIRTYNRDTTLHNIKYPDLESIQYPALDDIESFELAYIFANEEKGLELNLNFFRNSMSVTRSRVESARATLNQDEQITNGVELIAKSSWKIDASVGGPLWIDANLDLSYQRTEREVTREGLPREVDFSPAWLGGLRLTAKHKYVSLGLFANYVSSMKAPVNEVTEGNVTKFVPLSPETKDYLRLGFNFRLDGIRLFHEEGANFFCNLRISNLLDEQYRYPTHALVSWADRGVPGRPRQWLFTLGYNFK